MPAVLIELTRLFMLGADMADGTCTHQLLHRMVMTKPTVQCNNMICTKASI